MANSNRPTLRQLRALYRLVGNCVASGNLADAWCRQLHEGLTRILGAQVGLYLQISPQQAVMAEPFDRANWIRSYGWPTSESQALAQQYFQDNRQQKEVGIDRWKQMTGSIVTITRQDIADDREWYRSENFNRFFRVGRMDHMVNGKALTPQGDLLLLSLWRNLGDRPFTRRESRLLKLLLHEISTLYGKRLAPWHAQPGRQSLPPRQGQVLALLGKGLSEKEISAELKLSRHTVHDHVKALHRRFGVRSRGELLAELSRMLLEPKGTQI